MLSPRPKQYVIPEYSLTGDLLAFNKCGLQYRYQNRGSLPPSTPVQLWFGEFIHGVMEEAYHQWVQNQETLRFPWTWNPDVRNVEMQVHRRLIAKGLSPPPNLFCRQSTVTKTRGACGDVNHPHKLLASQRAEFAINTWGQPLFPLIAEPEVKLRNSRDMPNYTEGISRSNYYSINGIIDVLTEISLNRAFPGNLILHHLHQDPKTREKMDNLSGQGYEIIIDYKGMRRPPSSDDEWQQHEWQILTYSWLRSKQPGSKPQVAGILFYLNELRPSGQDISELRSEILNNSTDILPSGDDRRLIEQWRPSMPIPELSSVFREERSIRIIPINEINVPHSVKQFDDTVSAIENSVMRESHGTGLNQSWPARPVLRTCTACDFKIFCPASGKVGKFQPTVP